MESPRWNDEISPVYAWRLTSATAIIFSKPMTQAFMTLVAVGIVSGSLGALASTALPRHLL